MTLDQKLCKMHNGSYVFGGDQVMLLVPDGLGPADASAVAGRRLGHNGDLEVTSLRSCPGGAYVTYRAI